MLYKTTKKAMKISFILYQKTKFNQTKTKTFFGKTIIWRLGASNFYSYLK